MANTDFEMFEKFWREEIDKLDKGVIDGRGAQRLYLNFNHNRLRLENELPADAQNSVMIQKLDLLYSGLTRAIEMAHTRYNLKLAKISISVFVPIVILVIAIVLKL